MARRRILPAAVDAPDADPDRIPTRYLMEARFLPDGGSLVLRDGRRFTKVELLDAKEKALNAWAARRGAGRG